MGEKCKNETSELESGITVYALLWFTYLTVKISLFWKTTLLLLFIFKSWISYKNYYVYSKWLDQQAYKKLQDIYKNVEKEIGQKVSYFYSSCENLISVDDCYPNSLVIFRDCLLEN